MYKIKLSRAYLWLDTKLCRIEIHLPIEMKNNNCIISNIKKIQGKVIRTVIKFKHFANKQNFVLKE